MAKYSQHQAQEERNRILFEKRLGTQTEPVRHDKAAVLLLSWDESMDDLEVKCEVRYPCRFNKR